MSTITDILKKWNRKGCPFPWINIKLRPKFLVKFESKYIKNPVSKVLYTLSIVQWVLAGYDKSSYCLAYITTLSSYFWLTTNNTSLLKKWKILHVGFFVALLIVTLQDIAGYVSVPWIFTIACMLFYVFQLVSKINDNIFFLAATSFFLGVWQAIDTDVNY